MAATNLNISLANILHGKIVLDRAIKHLANRNGAAEPAVAIAIMEAKWEEIERERVRQLTRK